MRATTRGEAWRRRGDAALRLLAAIPGSYGVASLAAAATARVLPIAPAEAVMAASTAAFAVCAGCAMYAYAARDGVRAVAVLALIGGTFAAILWASLASGGRI